MAIPVQHPKIDTYGPNNTWVSGVVNGPIVGSIIVDTGALGAGDYDFLCSLGNSSLQFSPCVLEHRDSANLITLNTIPIVTEQESPQHLIGRITLAANERIRMVATAIAIGTVRGAIMYRQIG